MNLFIINLEVTFKALKPHGISCVNRCFRQNVEINAVDLKYIGRVEFDTKPKLDPKVFMTKFKRLLIEACEISAYDVLCTIDQNSKFVAIFTV